MFYKNHRLWGSKRYEINVRLVVVTLDSTSLLSYIHYNGIAWKCYCFFTCTRSSYDFVDALAGLCLMIKILSHSLLLSASTREKLFGPGLEVIKHLSCSTAWFILFINCLSLNSC